MANVALDSLTDTWNAGATTFRAIKMNVTDTASAAGSLLMDLQVGGNTKANVSKAGLLTLASGVTLTGANTLQTTTGALTLASGSSHIIATPTSNFGIGTTGPDRKLDVLDAGGSAQFRTTYTDGSVYTDYQTLSGGSTYISDSSGRMLNSTIVNNTAVSARARQGGLAFDGVTTTQALSGSLGSVGTSDVSVEFVFLCPTGTSSTYPIWQLKTSNTKTTETSSLNAQIVSGSLVVQLTGSGATTDWNKATLSSFVSNYGGKIVHCVFTRSGTTDTLYVNGVSQTLSETTNGTPPTWAGSISSGYYWVGSQDSNYFNSTIYIVRPFNRALSASEVVDLANKGVAESDKWASVTAKYTSDFSVGTDSFTAVNGTVTGNVDGIGGQNDNLSYYGNATVGNHAASRSTTVFAVGKRYRVQYSYYLPSTNTNLKKLAAFYSGGGTMESGVNSVTDAWTPVSFEINGVPSTVGLGIEFYGYNASNSLSFACANSPTNDLFYIRGITVTEIGCLLDADLAVGVGYQAPDRSSNHYDGLISTSGVSHVIEIRRQQARFSLSADGYLGDTTSRACIPADARIESIVAYSTGTPTFTIGDDSGSAANVVASVTLSASTVTDLTLLKRFLTTGTKGRCYVDFTAGAAATYFTINYSTTANY